jgi:hypothetical protein
LVNKCAAPHITCVGLTVWDQSEGKAMMRTLSLSSGAVDRILALQRLLQKEGVTPGVESSSSIPYRSERAGTEFFEAIDTLCDTAKKEIEALAWQF